MSFQQKILATCFLTFFMLGASWLLLTATILLNQPLDYAQEVNPPLVAGQRAETIEVLKEPIKVCSHNTQSGRKDCIPLEIVSSTAQNETSTDNQASDSSDSASSSSGVKREFVAVTWKGTIEPEKSEESVINNLSLEEAQEDTQEEAQNSVVIEPQNESSTLLEISDKPIPPEDKNQNDESLLTTDVEKDDVWELDNGLTELTPTPDLLSEPITATEQLALEETSDDAVQVTFETETLETNAEAEQGEHYFSEFFYHYWFSSEETQE